MKLEVAKDGKHKYTAVFDDGKRVSFGAKGYDDYTKTADQDQRARYLARHRATENWNTPYTAGSLSRWILWGESRAIQDNLRAFKRRFNMD